MRKEKLEELKYYLETLKTIEFTKKNKEPSFIKSEVYDCKLNSGEIITREKLLKGNKNGSAAIVLPITTDNEVILVIEPRVFTKKTVGIGLPAGYIEDGEKAIDSARRELKEETGYEAKELISLGGFYQDMGCSSAYNECFLATNCVKTGNQKLDESEYIKYFKCYFQEALELIDLGYIEGSNAIITFEKVKKLGGIYV